MVLIIVFILHWYLVMFFHTFFLHRYAAHHMWSMSKRTEDTIHFLSWIVSGSCYLSPYAYGILHRLHHAYTDTEKDPHSPHYDKSPVHMLWRTRQIYFGIFKGTIEVEEKYKVGIPRWAALEEFGHSFFVRALWILLYIAFYAAFATQWWMWLLLPATILMGPLHGAIINYYSHKVGYRNYQLKKDTSTNLMPFDLFFFGEVFHNNHHKAPSRPNLGFRKWEFDPLWPIVLTMEFFRIIKINRVDTPVPAMD
jgi:stearoyl-CoA desaturase (delta-9 desaturase)